MQTTASFAANLQGRTPLKALTGETPDISQYLAFVFYECVWFKEDSGLGENKLAIFLGVYHQVGSLMSYWFLPASGIPMLCTTLHRVANLESQTEQRKKIFSVYDKRIAEIFNEKYIDADYLQNNNDKPVIKISTIRRKGDRKRFRQ